MMKRIRIVMLAGAMLTSALFMGACAQQSASRSSGSSTESSTESSAESSTENSADNSSVSQASEDESQAASQENTESDEASVSDAEESSKAESEEKSKDESSQAESSYELEEASEISVDGYYFDDEQIVTDYHEAETFTSDEKFNELFAENSIDAAYLEECKELETVSDMRIIAMKYAGIWQEEANEAYDTLHELLEDKPDEQAKLEASQKSWLSTLGEVEESFREESDEDGTYGLLAADSAIMNYYKGRAAVLYQQVYVLTGEFSIE